MKKFFRNNSGQLSLQILIVGSLATVLIMGFVLWSSAYVKSVGRDMNKSQGFAIAEAGIEYYRWHLAHSPLDFTDGHAATSTGPYIHEYDDKNGNRMGQFELVITAPSSGTTIITIQSTGKVDADPTATKIIKIKMGLPSFARFSVAANSDIRFGAGTNVFGQLHSNGGIRFDGVAFNVVTSAQATYDDPDHSGANEFGVHTHTGVVDPFPPAAVPVRSDVFQAGRQFPVPAVDFNGLTQDLANIKAAAQTAGFYRGPSGAKGYELVLKTNDTFDLYKVNSVTNPPGGCADVLAQTGWGTWSINATSSVLTNVAFPANGLIFIEDDLWVRGQINTARLTIASGRFPVNPATYASITTNDNLLYTNFDGQDVLALMTQNNVNVGLNSNNNLTVDGAVVAQNGRVGRYYYGASCGANFTRNSMSLYGMIGTNQRYGWAYTDGTGYQTRTITYDGNLLYGPPPSFPITGSQYDIISWEEVK